MSPNKIPIDALEELINRNQERLEARIKNINIIGKELDKRGPKLSKISTFFKIFIIILGALIATRVVADRLFEVKRVPPENAALKTKIIPQTNPTAGGNVNKTEQRGSQLGVEIIYTILAVFIAILAGIDSAFKPGEQATEINFIKVRCKTYIMEIEEAWAKEVEYMGVSQQALDNSIALLHKIDTCLTETMTRLAQLKIHIKTGSLPHSRAT